MTRGGEGALAWTARHHVGVPAVAYPCDFHAEERPGWRLWLPSNAGPAMLEEALHEWLGLLYYRLRGWA